MQTWDDRKQQVFREMETGPVSKWDLVHRIGVDPRYAAFILRVLHRSGQVHVSHWAHQRQDAGTPTRFFAAGPGKDAPQPPPKGSR